MDDRAETEFYDEDELRRQADIRRYAQIGIQRITPMTVMADIAPAVASYRQAGFDIRETDVPECVGVSAGPSNLILTTIAHMALQFRGEIVNRLADHTVPYIYVESLGKAKTSLPADTKLLEETALPYGGTEAVFERDGRIFIMAEKGPAPGL